MKNIEDMNRTEILYELAGHAHSYWYHKILRWPTQDLRALLLYYRTGYPAVRVLV